MRSPIFLSVVSFLVTFVVLIFALDWAEAQGFVVQGSDVERVAPEVVSKEIETSEAPVAIRLEDRWVMGDVLLTFENGSYSGTTGCNRFVGNYIVGFGNRIEILPPKITDLICQNPTSQRLDQSFAQKIGGHYDYLYDGEHILLYNLNVTWFMQKAI